MATGVRRPPRQRQKRLTSAELAQLVEDRNAGSTIKALADRYGIHRHTVMHHLAQANVGPRTGKLAEDLDEARRLRAQGWSYARLGQRYGVHPETVRRNLMQCGT